MKKKLKLIKDALHDDGLSEFAKIIVIKMIVSPKKPSKECKEWAKKCLQERII